MNTVRQPNAPDVTERFQPKYRQPGTIIPTSQCEFLVHRAQIWLHSPRGSGRPSGLQRSRAVAILLRYRHLPPAGSRAISSGAVFLSCRFVYLDCLALSEVLRDDSFCSVQPLVWVALLNSYANPSRCSNFA